MIPGLSRLELALQNSWCPETTNNWESNNPARGHCAVTALIVQDFFKGEIRNCDAFFPTGRKESHYYNVINGEKADLTEQQFPQGTAFSQGKEKLQGMKNNIQIGPFKSTREYILGASSETIRRYEALRTKVLHFLLSYKEE